MMSPLSDERWQRIDAVLGRVLDAAPEARAAVLEKTCAGAPTVRRAVEALLEVEVPAFLDTSVLDFATSLLPEVLPDNPSSVPGRIGPYRVVRTLGRGGMGVVYLVERDDVPKRAALKLASTPVRSSEGMQQFLRERRLLAQLEHPHIAPLLDAGVTEAGHPYFTMEYVEGRPLHRYCDERRLPVEERLKLLAAVGDAVHYAHRNLIVHRDLKSSNILVTEPDVAGAETGRVKLLDFGIAKLIEGVEGLEATPTARTGRRWMTPEYAAPEQIRGEAVTTATDVYQLGVVLYELLAGRRPFERDGSSLHDLEQAILDEAPAPPSTTVDSGPRQLRRALRGDLDTICLKALRKDPARRYASVEAFVGDIRRHLAGLPVQARPDTFGYRVKKFGQRHRWGVVAAALFVLVLAGFAGAMAVQTHRVARERDRAQVETAKAEQVTAFMTDLFEASDPDEALGNTVTARELLARGVERAEALDDQPEVQAQMMSAIGASYERLGRYDRARPVLERALALQRATFGPEHEEVARGLNQLGALLGKMGEYEAAEAHLRRAVAMRRAGPAHRDLAVSLDELARVLEDQGQYDRAELLYREALALRQRLLGEAHRETATSLNDLGVLLWNKGEHEAAASRLRQALATYRTVFGHKHPWVASTLGNLALVAMDRGDYTGADSLFREALALNRALLGEAHPGVATTMHNWANSLRKQARYQEADSLLREALRIARSALGEAHPLVSHSLMSRAQIHLVWERSAEAEPFLREAIDIRQATLGEESWLVADAKSWLGACLTALARHEEAEPLLIEGYERLKERRGRQDRRTKEALERLVTLYETWGQPEEADAYRALQADAAEPVVR